MQGVLGRRCAVPIRKSSFTDLLLYCLEEAVAPLVSRVRRPLDAPRRWTGRQGALSDREGRNVRPARRSRP
jgi:hypothetical protein